MKYVMWHKTGTFSNMRDKRAKNHFDLTQSCTKCTEQQTLFGFVMIPSCHQLAYACWDDSLRTDRVRVHLCEHWLLNMKSPWWVMLIWCVFLTRRSRARNYDAELLRCRPEATLVEFGDYHPLKPIMVCRKPAHTTAALGVKTAQCVHSLSVCIMFWFSPKRHSPLCSGDGHKNPPWGSQRQHLLIFLLLVVCSNRSS